MDVLIRTKAKEQPGTKIVPAPEWADAVQNMMKQLEELNSASERDFMHIASNLQRYSDATREISRMSLSAVQIMSGDEIRGSITGIGTMVDTIHDLLDQVDGAADDNRVSLEEINRHLKLVSNDLMSLRKTTKDLKMFGLSTKIQSAGGGRDLSKFMHLGGEISDLSRVISMKFSGLWEQTKTLIAYVKMIHDDLQKLREVHRYQAGKVVSGARDVLNSLKALNNRSVHEAENISRFSEEISDGIGRLIVSIQYQDITRQALEKVRVEIEEIKDACSKIELRRGDVPGCHAMNQVRIARQSLQQAVCLRQNGRELVETVMDLMKNLEMISSNVGEMREVTSRASRDSSLFLCELEKGMSYVADFLSGVVESGREMFNAMRSLARRVGEISDFIDDIDEINSDVELIALNARIKAAHTGCAGEGMGIIADSIYRTAEETDNRMEILLSNLTNISRETEKLRGRLEGTTKVEERKLDNVVRELGMMMNSHRYMQEKIISLLDQIEVRGNELSGNIHDCLDSMDLTHKVERVTSEVTEDLRTMAMDIMDGIHPSDMTVPAGLQELFSTRRMTPEESVGLLLDMEKRDREEYFDIGGSKVGLRPVELFDT